MSVADGVTVKNLTVRKAKTFRLVIGYATTDDLTTYDLRCEFRSKADSPILAVFTKANSGMSVDDAAKEIFLDVKAEDSILWTFKKAVYDVQLIRPPLTDNDVVAVEGTVTVTENITE